MATSFEETVTDLRNDLVCRICESRARPGKTQWYRCLNLHQICQDCKGKSEKCSCNGPISEGHCNIIEKLLKTNGMKWNCKNTKTGCREVLVDYALEDHESICIYREVLCPIELSACTDLMFKDVIEHLEQKHGLTELSQHPNFKGSISKDDAFNCIASRFEFDGYDFISFIMSSNDLYTVFSLPYIIGSPNEAKHFSYTLKFTGPKTTLTFEGQVTSIDEPLETILRDGALCGISLHTFMKQFVDEDGKFEYSLEVKNLKKEAKDENYESGISDDDQDSKK